MTARRLQIAILSLVSLAVAALLVWAASTGPVRVVGTMHATEASHAPQQVPRTGGQVQSASSSPEAGRHHRPLPPPVHRSSWLGDALAILLLGGGLWLLVAVAKTLLERVSRDVAERRVVVPLEPLPDPDAAREALQRDHDLHFAGLEGDLRNGIVGCWVLLEEAAAEAGFPRRASETPTEFVVRFLHGLDVDPRPVARLAELYHEARFSTHRLPEDARGRAEAALVAIHADLALAGARA